MDEQQFWNDNKLSTWERRIIYLRIDVVVLAAKIAAAHFYGLGSGSVQTATVRIAEDRLFFFRCEVA